MGANSNQTVTRPARLQISMDCFGLNWYESTVCIVTPKTPRTDGSKMFAIQIDNCKMSLYHAVTAQPDRRTWWDGPKMKILLTWHHHHDVIQALLFTIFFNRINFIVRCTYKKRRNAFGGAKYTEFEGTGVLWPFVIVWVSTKLNPVSLQYSHDPKTWIP